MNAIRILLGSVMLAALAGVLPAQTPVPKQTEVTKPMPPPTKEKSMLEEALEQALKNNPDLRVALAKVAEAEAELARVKLEITRKVIAAEAEIRVQRAKLVEQDRRVDALARLRNLAKGSVSDDDYQAARAVIPQTKAKIDAAVAELNYLTGKDVTRTTGERLEYYRALRQLSQLSGGGGSGKTAPKGEAADRLRKALEKKSSFKFTNLTAAQMLELLQKETGGLHIQADTRGQNAWGEKVNVTLTDVSVAAAFQLLEDTLGSHRVVVRDYGLLIVPQEKVPPGAVRLGEFLKSKVTPPTTTPAEKSGGR